MKTYTIGRDTNCDIYIDDKMISRRHALLKVFPLGKMELVDMSSNGTYLNGIRLKANSPMPVSRKDVVSFAHVQTMDWSMVPNPLGWVKWAIIAIVALSLLILSVKLIASLSSTASTDESELTENYWDETRSGAKQSDKEKAKQKNSSNKVSEATKTEDSKTANATKKGNNETTVVDNQRTEAETTASTDEPKWIKDIEREEANKRMTAAARKKTANKGESKKESQDSKAKQEKAEDDNVYAF